jgi:cytochrome c oxidase subunit 2
MGSKLITLIVIVLGVIAIAQLVRVYELSSKLRKRGEHEISTRDNNLNAKLMLLFMFLFYAGFIYLMATYGWTGRGESASVHGDGIDWLLNLNFVIIIAIFFLTNTLLFYFVYKYVRKAGVKAVYFSHSNKLEMIWTIIPAVVLAVIIILGLQQWNDSTSYADKEAIRIELFSKQFDWTARYAGVDNNLGRFDYKLTTDNNELALMTTQTIDSAIFAMENGPTGIKALETKLNDRTLIFVPEDLEKMQNDLARKSRLIRLLHQMKERHSAKIDASAWDDIIQKDTLYLCVNKQYEFNFRAKDVIHSAHFPHFRAQMNTVPGLTTRFKFTPDITTKQMREKKKDDKFQFVLLCNKICGGAHYKMKMIVVVLPQNEYKAWMKSKAKQTFRDKYFAVAAPSAPADTLAVGTDTAMVAVN